MPLVIIEYEGNTDRGLALAAVLAATWRQVNNAQPDVGAGENQILSMAKDIVYTHHEWWNGTGCPGASRPV